MGRPTEIEHITEEQKQRMFTYLRNGAPMKYAVRSIGVADRTIREWREKAHKGMEPYMSFMAEVEQAEAVLVCENFAIINMDGRGNQKLPGGETRRPGDYRALTWLIEKLHPKDFAPLQKMSGPDGETPLVAAAPVMILPAKEVEEFVAPPPPPPTDDDA